ncbi:MAG: 5-(carboxyamino)imidazole ribonucleotide mutase [Candidatus Omnitrophica bacterium]|nr:5-(carboxyamino)imidazole ribonucleotide mutase [Candidatus Omnitrophota bacterium]
MKTVLISIILGSRSDLPYWEKTLSLLEECRVDYELKILSAHRDSELLEKYVKSLPRRGIKVVIASAGGAAALPGVVAAQTFLPVIGVPIPTKVFKGVDSLLSILQMPKGVPVATMAVGGAGPLNAAIFAMRIISLAKKNYQEKTNHFLKLLKTKN